jgi:tripartite-type tricarboxylate transporter receptor subunit TctC
MKDKLGVAMIVKNIPGGGGRTGLNTLYRSKPDGYTIGMLNIPGFAVSQLIKKTLYDLEKMEYIAKISEDRYLVPVKAYSPFNSINDLKNAGRPIKVGAIGTTSTGPVLCMISFSTMGIPFEFVTGYKSSVECILAVMRGDVDTTMSGPIGTNLPFINNGDIKALLTFTKERRSELPNVITIGEIG